MCMIFHRVIEIRLHAILWFLTSLKNHVHKLLSPGLGLIQSPYNHIKKLPFWFNQYLLLLLVVHWLSWVWLFGPQGLQHSTLPCPSLSPRVCSDSCPFGQWCFLTIYLSASPFCSWPQSFPASGSFPMSWLFTSGGQTIGASASASVLPVNIPGWYPLGVSGLVSLLSKGLSRVFSSTTIWKHQFLATRLSSWPNSHIHTWLLEKPSFWLYAPLLAKWHLCFVILCQGLS